MFDLPEGVSLIFHLSGIAPLCHHINDLEVGNQ